MNHLYILRNWILVSLIEFIFSCSGFAQIEIDQIKQWLKEIDTIQDLQKYDKDEMGKKLDDLSAMISVDPQLEFYDAAPENRLISYVDFEKHVLKQRQFVYETFSKRIPSEILMSIRNMLTRIANVSKIPNAEKVYQILVIQLCIPEEEEYLEKKLTSPSFLEVYVPTMILGEACNRKSIPLLERMVREISNTYVKMQAAKFLLIMKNRTGVEVLYQLANQAGVNQEKACLILIDNGSLEDLQYSFNILKTGDFSPYIKLKLFRYIANQYPRLTDEIKNQIVWYYDENITLFTQNTETKSTAIHGLSHLSNPSVIDRIAPYAADPSPAVVIAAVSQLGFLKARDCTALVASQLESENPEVRIFAMMALENILLPPDQKITKQEFLAQNPDLEKTLNQKKTWWKENAANYPLPEKYQALIKK